MSNQATLTILIRAARQSADGLSSHLQGLVASLGGQLDALEADLWVITSQGDVGTAAEALGGLFDSGLVSYLGFGDRA
ncbi:hypothetical protein E8F11_06445 [Pseudomonas sp. BN417]|uniref:hypothetical protein n=1 Tax=Pseudomonas sp. BN417 TaxID=2567890 RepID=UPI00245881E6|nr:hypothetical protein [Pseudomonas sp. BN417]MDH4554819.1 hypothetical protein [Pseudomonas sp. BN417]